jgi:hypothetical protein
MIAIGLSLGHGRFDICLIKMQAQTEILYYQIMHGICYIYEMI